MAPRTTWKGFLTLARVTCPVRLHPALIRLDRLGFQALNRATLNRVQMRPHDPQTGKEVARESLVRGYEVEAGRFALVEDRDLAELQIESSRSIALERFFDRGAVDIAYIETPYFIVPDGRGADVAYAVIRDAMIRTGKIGLGRLVLASRERAVLIEPRGRGMMLATLRAAHEVRGEESYFGDVDPTTSREDMVALAAQIITHRLGTFDPKRDFRDRYQEALFDLVQAKLKGEKPMLPKAPPPAPVIELRQALEESVAAADQPKPPAPSRKPGSTRRSGQEGQSTG